MAKKKRPVRKPAKTTALVLRKRTSIVRSRTINVPAPAAPNGYTVAADGSLQLGALGLVELKLTPDEEKVLSERVNPDDVRWRPSRKGGPADIPYLPHPVYTGWFCRAFGRTGWVLVPIGKPVKTEQSVVLVPYVLHVHRMPIAFAWGEQEFFDTKADGTESRAQTYGDVIESTVASALRRCAKHLGVGLELWDREWIKKVRRPDDPPQTQQARGRQRNGRKSAPAPKVEHPDLDAKISDDKRIRLWNISRRCGRGDEEVKGWLMTRYNLKASTDITNRQYDDIVTYIEQPGPLPMSEQE